MVNRRFALHTPLCDLLGCEWPIMLAGMGGVARHRLAAAVSHAGGFGVLGMVREPAERIAREIDALRGEGVERFAINLIPAATERTLLHAQVDLCIRKAVPWMALFWEVDHDLVRHLKAEGIRVIHQVGHRQDAERALRAGADVLIAQGYEAGGHVRGETGILPLLSDLVPLSPVPVVASGGIADGRGLAAALALGAQGVSLGSAFLATHESNAHDHHKFRLLQARAEDTVHTRRFNRNWHEDAPVRVLTNRVTRGEYDDLKANGIAEIIGEQDGKPVYLFSTDSPLADATGELDDMALYAGQSCSRINALTSARERITTLIEEARQALNPP
ncbi:NAD(P)H-dependent flavin oxidoreductase [Alloalcanivorax mobilis]|uniref:NAD(P)H-dependent flavin oxidoreductase n=1 Tax=Alloalcanivorax mobilis TaxID=2019569 RepID=UPI000B5B26ED|nr:nitronate monooxygenase [Alloalcanivorax mobilis]ASK34544.1 2-nitropropane dioxygenase [Alcanivorax sp. N3-2A]|tara:strand:+ start:4818 stop:5813 length:996 start_codon:yes stop_codon:yes gene_type:complete